MPRTRDQFTGHTWLHALDRDTISGQADVWDHTTVTTNLDFLTGMHYLCLAQAGNTGYVVTIYPRTDAPPPLAARFAARYRGQSLPVLMQAAANDYGHLLGRTAHAQTSTFAWTRLVTQHPVDETCDSDR